MEIRENVHNLDSNERFDRATRLIHAATGQKYGDGVVVHNIGRGYAEPGYGDWNTPDEDDIWILGDWNNKTRYDRETKTHELLDDMPSRLGTALERYALVNLEWLDEWMECTDCYRIFRSTGDSYSWSMYGAILNECEPVCADCLNNDVRSTVEAYQADDSPYGDDSQDPDWLGEYINNHRTALTFDIDLAGLGFERFNGTYENGWHEWMDDDPEKISEHARSLGWRDLIFYISGPSQFYISFQLWVRGCSHEREQEMCSWESADGCEHEHGTSRNCRDYPNILTVAEAIKRAHERA